MLMGWTVRYRFRVSKALRSDESELTFAIGGRAGVVSGEGGKQLSESYWLTLNVHNLESEDVAHEFGRSVVRAILLAAAQLDIGIDGGEDKATSGFGAVVAKMIEDHGGKLMPNVHGLLIYERQGNEVFFDVGATFKVSIDPGSFFTETASSFDLADGLGSREHTALTLLALSKSAREPLAEATLCISAVEYLSSDKPWTPDQCDLLKRLQEQAASTELPSGQAKDVASALQAVFKSIRQSIKRKMIALGFTDTDVNAFDELYELRSRIFHGSITARQKHAELASKAREICTRIVLAAAADANTR